MVILGVTGMQVKDSIPEWTVEFEDPYFWLRVSELTEPSDWELLTKYLMFRLDIVAWKEILLDTGDKVDHRSRDTLPGTPRVRKVLGTKLYGNEWFVRCEVVTIVNCSHLHNNPDLLDAVASFCGRGT